MSKREYTESQVIFIKEQRLQGREWNEIAAAFNGEFKTDRTASGVETAYRRYADLYEIEDEEKYLDILRDTRRTKQRSSKLHTQNNRLIDYLHSSKEVIDAVKEAISTIKIRKPKINMSVRQQSKHSMTMELLLSDLHFGKVTPKFNAEIARKRMQELVSVFIREYNDNKRLFSIDRIIIAMMGDMIESYTMHNLESAMACEMTNSEQIMLAINSLFEDVLVPLAHLGVEITVPCVTGNHDRTEREKTYNYAGRSNVTWIIYNTLRELCRVSGFDHIKFHIAEQNYVLVDIYGNSCLYEHGDHIKNTNQSTIETHVSKRATQLGRLVNFIRIGHWHEVISYGQGKIIVNGSLPGQDSYADTRGFDSHAFQVINFYIETDHRPNCFYKSFPVYLGGS